jgi:hypothetical protein
MCSFLIKAMMSSGMERARERERKEPHLLEKNVSGKISHKCSHIEYWRSVKEAGSVTDRE